MTEGLADYRPLTGRVAGRDDRDVRDVTVVRQPPRCLAGPAARLLLLTLDAVLRPERLERPRPRRPRTGRTGAGCRRPGGPAAAAALLRRRMTDRYALSAICV